MHPELPFTLITIYRGPLYPIYIYIHTHALNPFPSFQSWRPIGTFHSTYSNGLSKLVFQEGHLETGKFDDGERGRVDYISLDPETIKKNESFKAKCMGSSPWVPAEDILYIV